MNFNLFVFQTQWCTKKTVLTQIFFFFKYSFMVESNEFIILSCHEYLSYL